MENRVGSVPWQVKNFLQPTLGDGGRKPVPHAYSLIFLVPNGWASLGDLPRELFMC